MVILLILILGSAEFQLLGIPRFKAVADTVKQIDKSQDFSKRITITKIDTLLQDELTEIKVNTNKFLDRIENLTEKLKRTNVSLEEQVKKRTEDLLFEIEQRRIVEAKLIESEQRFRKMAERLQDGIVIIENGNVSFANDKAKQLLATDFSDFKMETLWQLIDRENIEKARKLFSKMKNSNNTLKASISFWITRPDGIKKYLHFTYFPDSEQELNKKQYITITDITEQKISEERYKSVVENAQEAILVIQNKKIKYFNNKIPTAIGYKNEELSSLPFIEFVHPEDIQKVEELYQTYRENKVIPKTEIRIKKKDNSTIWAEISATQIRWENKPAAPVFINDITTQKKAEKEQQRLTEQLNQMQKLAAIQNLAGGIAHDLNNILTPIIGYTDLALMEEENSKSTKNYLNEIKHNTKRAAELIRKLLAFSRKQRLQRENLNINSIIHDLKGMLERLIAETIKIEYNFSKNLPLISADKNQIEQIIINLIVNAKDAMPEGGTITITTYTSTLENSILEQEKVIVDPETTNREFVCLSVTDTGIGMDPETQKNIFEPFFTTKEFAKSSGLGLSVVYGIVKQHDGFIEVESKNGSGSNFNIYFPITDSTSTEEIRTIRNSTMKFPNGNDKSILIVEDNPNIRTFTGTLFKKLNFSVIETNNAEEGEKIFKENIKKIALVISDIVLPQKSGIDLLHTLRKYNPPLPIILTSGYAPQANLIELIDNKNTFFLHKPYTIEQLITTINKINSPFNNS